VRSAHDVPILDRQISGRPPQRSVPILMYHQIMPRPPQVFQKYVTTPKAFAAQMRWLDLAGYTPIGLDDLLAHRHASASLPRRPVIITFDDGFQGCADHAAPVLQSRGFTATFYLVAGLIGQPSRWLLPTVGIEFPLMTWSTARDLQAAGFTCGAHSLTHPHLGDLPAEECRTELKRSRELLEHHLGCDVTHLAYPFGSYDDRVREITAELGYRSACSVTIGLSQPDDDLLALQRVPVTGYDTLPDFICRVRTAHTVSELMPPKARRIWYRVRRFAGGVALR
jgi:peptidoglycan/xylan/chitin deacetylase (PgdA/CDA1 family)